MRNSKASLFLMELVIVILFFSLSSAVCIQLFVKAHSIDKQTVEMNHSVIWIQNMAESFHACDGNISKVKELYKATDVSDSVDEITLLFDKDWKEITSVTDAEYMVHTTVNTASNSTVSSESESGIMHAIDINISNADTPDNPLYSQHLDHYAPGKEVQ